MMSDDWRVGILFSRSGVTAGVEVTQANGALLAIEEINNRGGVRGRKISPIFRDPQSAPKLYGQLARTLLVDEDVKIIFGGYMSSTRKAVLPEVEAHRGLLFYPTFYEGFEYSPWCFYGGAASNQNAVPLTRYLMKEFGPRFLLVGSNYVFPYEYNRVVTDLVTLSKGKILDEIYVPLDAKREDFNRAISRIKKLEPDVIVSTVVGTSVTYFYEAYQEAGFSPASMPIAAATTTEAEIAQMPLAAAVGHFTSTPFFETVQSEAARRFVEAYKARFGADAPVTACAEAAYTQVHMYAKAVELTGTDNPEIIAAALAGMEFDAPQGRVRIDPSNHHTELWPRIGRVDRNGKFEVVWETATRIKPDPYFVTPSLDGWSNLADEHSF